MMRSSRDQIDFASSDLPPDLPVKLRQKSAPNIHQHNRPSSQYDGRRSESNSISSSSDYFKTASSISTSNHSLSSQRSSYVESQRARRGMVSIVEDHTGQVTLRRPPTSANDSNGYDRPPPLPPKKRNITAYMHNISTFYEPSDSMLKEYRASVNTCRAFDLRHVHKQVEMSFYEHRNESFFSERKHSHSASSGSDESMWSTASSTAGAANCNSGSYNTMTKQLAETTLNNVNKFEAVPPLLMPPVLPPKSKQTKQNCSTLSAPSTRQSSPLRAATNTSDKDSGVSSHSGGSSPTAPVRSAKPHKSSPSKVVKGALDSVDVSQWLIFKSEDGHEVRGGTVDALIVKATEKDSELLFVEAFVATYRTFISPRELVDKLIYRYTKFLNADTRQKVAINAFALLVSVVDDLCVSDCQDDLMNTLTEFVNQMVKKGDVKLARFLEHKTREKKENRKSLVSASSPILLPSVAISTKVNSLTDFKSKLMAEQMTLLDQQLFTRIEMAECLIYAKEQREELIPNLTKFTEHFNKMSYWARSLILREEDSRDRERLLQKLLKIIKHLRKLNNFNSYLALVSALDSAPVRRLDWPKTMQQEIKDYSALIDSSSSFKTYRQVLAETEPPCIPYIGLLLQDLFFINQGNSDLLPDGKINFDKRWKLFDRIDELRRFRLSQYPFKKNEPIINYFGNFDDYLHEESMWQISESIKPRGKK